MEDNKLIDEFMGVQPRYFNPSHKDINYHNSWNMLMPVVEKIIAYEYDFGSDHAYLRTFGMLSSSKKPLVRFNRCPVYEGNTLIEATYTAVVEFIKYYNQKV